MTSYKVLLKCYGTATDSLRKCYGLATKSKNCSRIVAI